MSDILDILRIPCRCEEEDGKLRKSCQAYSTCWQEREAADEIERLREALGWYANRDNYQTGRLDLGLRARAALKQE